MLDSQLLAACIADRAAYERIKDHINAKDLSPPIGFWFDRVAGYYTRDRLANKVDLALLRDVGNREITNPKHKDALLAALDHLPETSTANVVEYVLAIRRYNLTAEFASASMAHDRKKADKLLRELNEIWDVQSLEKVSEVEYAKDWDELDSVVGAGRRIPLGIQSLDNRIGNGVLPGHHMLVFGRTEVGKSCLALSITANLVSGGNRVLYCGNEDEINILKSRIRLALLKQPQEWVDSHPNKSRRLLAERSADRLTMVKLTPGSVSELEDLVEKHTPQILVVDQIRNLAGPEDGMTQRMEGNAIRLRSLLLAKKLVGLSITQAGDRSDNHNSDGPLYLSAGDVDSSRVGLPGQVDLQIGVGATREMLSRGLRMLSFAKNKLACGPTSREPLAVRFDLATTTVSDIGG